MVAPRALQVVALATLAVAAWASGQIESRRPLLTEPGVGGHTFEVISGEDAGRGSLREALFAAATSTAPARIVVRSRVRLVTPLPPVVHSAGLDIEGRGLARLDASALEGGTALDLRSPGTIIRGLRVEGAEIAIRVRAADIELRNVTVAECDQGLVVEASARGFLLADSTFEDNRLGVALPAEPRGMRLEGNRFLRHREVAVRAVSAGLAPGSDVLALFGNRFEDDQVSLVLANVAAMVENNDVMGAREAGFYLLGVGTVANGNRLRDGELHGIVAYDSHDEEITGNEISGHAGVGLLASGGSGTRIENNRLRRNGYGIATFFGTSDPPLVVQGNTLVDQRYDGIYVVGASPRLRGNRSTGAGGAGLHVLDYVPRAGVRATASPQMEGNELDGNRLGAILHGDYRERE